jgi:hypothetical protein
MQFIRTLLGKYITLSPVVSARSHPGFLQGIGGKTEGANAPDLVSFGRVIGKQDRQSVARSWFQGRRIRWSRIVKVC